MSFGVVIAAAGQGKRMGTLDKKQFIQLQNKPILYHTVQLFKNIPFVKNIVVVTSIEDIARTEEMLIDLAPITIVAGGIDRQESVFIGLKSLQHVDHVLIHDSVRPFVTPGLIERVMNKVLKVGAVIPAVPVKDTIKIVSDDGQVESTPLRQSLWAVQTPQAFRLSTILNAHERAQTERYSSTDDAMLLEWVGEKVSVIEGEYTNIKITTPEDLRMAHLILEERKG